jgi:hypothetical protein
VHKYRGVPMKFAIARLLLGALAAMLIVAVAQAQGVSPQQQRAILNDKKAKEEEKEKEKAYKDALKSVPAQEKPRDPWAGTR